MTLIEQYKAALQPSDTVAQTRDAARVLLAEVRQIDHHIIPHIQRVDCRDGHAVFGDYLAMFRAGLRALAAREDTDDG